MGEGFVTYSTTVGYLREFCVVKGINWDTGMGFWHFKLYLVLGEWLDEYEELSYTPPRCALDF